MANRCAEVEILKSISKNHYVYKSSKKSNIDAKNYSWSAQETTLVSDRKEASG